MHSLLERQIKHGLGLEAEQYAQLAEILQHPHNLNAADIPELLRALSGLPALLDRIDETYSQQDLDLAMSRRSLALSSFETMRRHAGEAVGSHDAQADDVGNMADHIADLTHEQERIRRALALSEERFDLAMLGSNDGLWDQDLVNNTVHYSPRWKAMLGYESNELDNSLSVWSSRVHVDDLPDAMAAIQSHLRGESPQLETQFRMRHKDGRYLWMLARGLAIRDAHAQPVRMVGTLTDISQRVELEALLSQYKLALDAHAIVSMTDIAGNITYANDKFCEISGYSRSELMGNNHRLLKSGLHPESLYREMWAHISAGATWSGEVCNRAKNGKQYWVLATMAPIFGPDGLPAQYISIRVDITRFKAAEAALIQAKESAEAANQAKSEFLANMSHEIRTPMNGVLGMLNLALDTALDSRQQEYLSLAQSSANGLLHILNDILDLSKIEAGHLDIQTEPSEIVALADELGRFFEPRCRAKDIEFVVQTDASLPAQALFDPLRVRQVLINLLGNAVKFTASGRIVLDIRRTAEALPVANATFTKECIRFCVRDSGIGIPAERQASVFEAFTQADGSITRRYGGTGLGLTISTRLVRLMGGRMGLESTLGKGSEFFFTLPLQETTAASAAASLLVASKSAQNQAVPPSSGTLSILLAEDNKVNQLIAQAMLVRAGHQVRVVEDGGAALIAMQQSHFDLVLMDMQMPGMDGLEATRQIRALESAARHVPIIAVTANAFDEDRQRCLAAGMDGFVTKPFRSEALLTSIATVLAKLASDSA